jgi:hypothetical protein
MSDLPKDTETNIKALELAIEAYGTMPADVVVDRATVFAHFLRTGGRGQMAIVSNKRLEGPEA